MNVTAISYHTGNVVGGFPGLFVGVCVCFYKVLLQEQNTSKPCISLSSWLY